MVSNLSETLKKAYDDAVIAGAEQTKNEIVVNMLSKKMDEKLISDITGFLIDRIKKIKQTNLLTRFIKKDPPILMVGGFISALFVE